MVFQLGMMAGLGMGIGLTMAIVGIVVGALFLWVSARIFKLHDKSFVTPLIISAIVGAVGFVIGLIPFLRYLGFIVTIVLEVWLIKSKYHEDWGKSILVWLVAFVLSAAVTAVIMLVFFGTMLTGLGMFGGMMQ